MNDHSAATSGHETPNAVAPAAVTVEQAAAILGVSITTVKRRIRSGILRAEQAQRPQGTVWLVYLPAAATPAAEERPPAASVAATAPTTPATQAEALTGLVQATVATVLGPLVVELGAGRQTIERQAERLEAQAETIGQLRAENAARDQQMKPPSSVSPERLSVPTNHWVMAALWISLALLGVAVATYIVGWLGVGLSRAVTACGLWFDILGAMAVGLGVLRPPRDLRARWFGLPPDLMQWFRDGQRDAQVGLGLLCVGFLGQLVGTVLP